MLKTRLYRPPVSNEHIYREHLINYLDQNRHKPFTLVSAPAGYGKSMLISSWMERCKCPSAWISLSDEVDELNIFLKYLCAGIRGCFPGSLENIFKLIDAAKLPSVKVLSEFLINDLDDIPEDFILILDDYHLIQNLKINDLVNTLIKYPPQNLHLVIIARRDPMLDLTRLSAYNRMNQIRMSDLIFNKDEVHTLYKRLIGIDLENELAEKLVQKSEGWITGLRLASLSIRKLGNDSPVLKEESGEFHIVANYLVQEVLQDLPEHIRNFLLVSSLFKRFSSDLLEQIRRVMSREGQFELSGKAFIEWLLKSDLFIISLDNQNKWFRYHHLFRDLLERQLLDFYEQHEIQSFHFHGSQWFEKLGMLEEAIYHALLAGRGQLPEQIINRHRDHLMNTEQWNRLDHCIHMLPESSIIRSPLLLTSKAFYLDYRGRTMETTPLLDMVESILKPLSTHKDHNKQCLGEYYTLLAEKLFIQGEFLASREYAQQALNLLDKKAAYAKSFALYWYAFSLHSMGKSQEALEFITASLKNPEMFERKAHPRLNIALCVIHFMNGEFNHLETVAARVLEQGIAYQLKESIDMAHYFLGSAHYFRNDPEKAEHHLSLLYQNRYDNRLTYAAIGCIVLILIYRNERKFREMQEMHDSLLEYTDDLQIPTSSEYARALNAELSLFQGKPSKALEYDRHADYQVFPPTWFAFLPQLVSIRTLILSENGNKEQYVGEKIDIQLQYARANHNKYFELLVLLLKAWYFTIQGKNKEALELVDESLNLGVRGTNIRSFLDYGFAMRKLIGQLPEDHPQINFINQLLHAFSLEEARRAGADSPDAPIDGKEDGYEPLSMREIEILKLVAGGLRNKEIAEKLFLSDGTIKKHVYNISQKLNTSSRIGSVKKAEELSII